MTELLEAAARHICSGIYWDGASPGSSRVQRELEQKAKKEIQDLWEQGNLPYQIDDKHWVAGMYIHMSFTGRYHYPIVVGPAKPSKYRDSYCKASSS